jgi:hypothetical protein
MTIEAYKAAHSISEPTHQGDPTKFNGKASRKCPCGRNLQHGTSFDLCAKCRRAQKAESREKQEQEKKPMKNQQGLPVQTCSVEGCWQSPTSE